MLAHRKEEEVLMSGYIYVHAFQITGLGVIKHKTDISPFERTDSYIKNTLTYSWRAQKWTWMERFVMPFDRRKQNLIDVNYL